MMSGSNEYVEMYLKRLYELHLSAPDQPVRTGQIAAVMEVSDQSASEMLARLGDRGLVDRVPYKGATLNDEGLRIAAGVKRRELLLEVFLDRMLGYDGDLNEAACRLEHALSPDLERLIDRLLGYPERGMDGICIPSEGRAIEPFPPEVLIPLRALPDGASGVISIILFDGAVNRTLESSGIEIDARIQRDGPSFALGESSLILSNDVADRILVRLAP